MADAQIYLIVLSVLVVLFGVGSFLLLLGYQNKQQCFPDFWKERHIFQGKFKKRRKGEMLEGHHHDTLCIRQRCPESTCDVCNRAIDIAEVNQLRFPQVLEECTRKQDGTKNMTLPTSSCSSDQQAMPRNHVSGHMPTQHNRLSFLANNIQEHLEKHVKKRAAFQIFGKEKNTRLFYRQIWTEYTQTSSDESLHSHDAKATRDPRTDHNSESNSDQISASQQFLYVKSFKENMPNSQLFWGLPSLHSESLVATVLVSNQNSPLDRNFVYFNGICNAPMVQKRDQEYAPIPHCHSLPLSKVYSDPFASSKYQGQHLHFSQPQVQPQTRLQSELPILPSSFLPQTRNSGMSLHRFPAESDSHTTSENKNLERNVLQKQQERLWGLLPVIKKSQGVIYPQTPNIPLVNQSSKVYVPVSLLPGHFHITNESQQNLTPHLPRRIISPWCLHACRNPASSTVMVPQLAATETAQHSTSPSYSQHSELQGQNHKGLTNTEWHVLGSFHQNIPIKTQLQNDGRRNLCHILAKSPDDSPQRISTGYIKDDLGTDPEARNSYVYYTQTYSGSGLFNVFKKNIGINQVKTILRLHLSRKFWQMTMGRIPLCVCRSWLGDGNTLSSASPQANTGKVEPENTTEDRAYCQITAPEPSFIDSITRQTLESHIIRFRASQRWGIPLKAVKSIKLYMSREARTWPLPQFEVPSSSTQVSKAETSKSHEKHSQTLHGHQVTTTSVSSLGYVIPAPSSINQERWEALERCPSNAKQEFAVGFQGVNTGGQTILSVTHSSMDTVSLREMDHTCKAEVPTMQNGTVKETKNNDVLFSENTDVIQVQSKMNNDLEHIVLSNVSREIFKAEELWCPQSQSSDSLKSPESRSSQLISLHEDKVQISSECLTPKAEVYENARLIDNKRQVVNNKLKEYREVNRPPSDMSVTSGYLYSESSLSHDPSISSSDIETPRISESENGGLRTEKHSEPTHGRKQHDPWKWHNCYPPDSRVEFQAEEYGREDSEEQMSTIRGSQELAEDRVLKDASPSTSQNKECHGSFPFPESYLRKKMRQFFQWIDTKRQNLGQEQLLQKLKFSSILVQHQDPLESGSTFLRSESPEGIELMTAIGDMLEEKLAQVHTETSSVTQQQTQGYVRQCSSADGVLPDPQQRAPEPTKPGCHEPLSMGQSCLRYVQQVLDKHRPPSTVVTSRDQTPCQSQGSSLPLRRLMHLQRPFCIPQVCQLPPVAANHDENSVFNDLKLLFQQKALFQHFKQRDSTL